MSLVLRPVQEPMPSETSEPIPAAIRPGTRTILNWEPPSPIASIRIIDAIRGEPRRKETAAKVDEAATMSTICCGGSFCNRLAASTPSPPPIAISGASGPITAPRPIEARAARVTPGRASGPSRSVLSPFAGVWPPLPGRRTIAKAAISPAMASTTRYHQFGAPLS